MKLMQTYVINLPAETKRKEVFFDNFNSFDFININIIQAIKAKKFPINAIELYMQNKLEFRYSSKAEIACFKSHQKALRTFLKTKDDFGLIMEDDCMPLESFPKTLLEIIDFCENNAFDIVNLSGYKDRYSLNIHPLTSNSIIRYNYFPPSAVAYIVSRKCAEQIISFPILATYDVLLQFSAICNIEIYHLKHIICKQNPVFDSCIDKYDTPRKEMSKNKRNRQNKVLYILGRINQNIYKRYIVFKQNFNKIGIYESFKGALYNIGKIVFKL